VNNNRFCSYLQFI